MVDDLAEESDDDDDDQEVDGSQRIVPQSLRSKKDKSKKQTQSAIDGMSTASGMITSSVNTNQSVPVYQAFATNRSVTGNNQTDTTMKDANHPLNTSLNPQSKKTSPNKSQQQSSRQQQLLQQQPSFTMPTNKYTGIQGMVEGDRPNQGKFTGQ